jgi:hypothetical protein
MVEHSSNLRVELTFFRVDMNLVVTGVYFSPPLAHLQHILVFLVP